MRDCETFLIFNFFDFDFDFFLCVDFLESCLIGQVPRFSQIKMRPFETTLLLGKSGTFFYLSPVVEAKKLVV